MVLARGMAELILTSLASIRNRPLYAEQETADGRIYNIKPVNNMQRSRKTVHASSSVNIYLNA